jgi:hypothetical protein
MKDPKKEETNPHQPAFPLFILLSELVLLFKFGGCDSSSCKGCSTRYTIEGEIRKREGRDGEWERRREAEGEDGKEECARRFVPVI